jgi:hypothetical protein
VKARSEWIQLNIISNGLRGYCNSSERGRRKIRRRVRCALLLRVLTPALWGYRKTVLWLQIDGKTVIMTKRVSRVRHYW